MEKIVIHGEFDLDQLKADIESATKIEDGNEFFAQLSEVQRVKAELKALEDLLKSIEADAKGLINAKAKALYGDDWQSIKGDTFKITRSRTGDVFLISGRPGTKFVKVKKTVDSDAVKEHLAIHDGKLPSGIEYNPQRGESIRVTVNENN